MPLAYTDEELKHLLQVDDDCTDLNQYLEKFPFPLLFLQTKEGLSKSVELLCEELYKNGIIYAEIRYAPQLHCDKGMTQRNEMKIFKNNEFGTIRIVFDEWGNPWFCGKDICDALGYKNSRRVIEKKVDKGDVTKRYTPTISSEQLMTYVNESGLYSLILSSKLESARQFKHWVTSEMLPAIRKQCHS